MHSPPADMLNALQRKRAAHHQLFAHIFLRHRFAAAAAATTAAAGAAQAPPAAGAAAPSIPLQQPAAATGRAAGAAGAQRGGGGATAAAAATAAGAAGAYVNPGLLQVPGLEQGRCFRLPPSIKRRHARVLGLLLLVLREQGPVGAALTLALACGLMVVVVVWSSRRAQSIAQPWHGSWSRSTCMVRAAGHGFEHSHSLRN